MAWHEFERPDEAAKFLADLDFSVTDTQQLEDGNQTGYRCRIQEHDKTLDFSVWLPIGAAPPDVCDAMRSLVPDAILAERGIDVFAEEHGITKPSQAVLLYEKAKEASDFLNSELYIARYDLLQLSATLEEHFDEVREAAAAITAERAAEYERTHPNVPEGFVSIESLQADLDLGDYGDQLTEYEGDISDAIGECADGNIDIYYYDLLKWLPDNYEWIEEADKQGLLEGCEGDIMQMTQRGQYECFTQDMYDHQEDICKNYVLESLKDAGIYAVSQELADALGTEIDYANADRFDELVDDAKEQVQSVMAVNLENTLGDEDIAQEAAEELVSDDAYDTVNPCALSAEAVHAVNEKGYEAAFAECEFWKNYVGVKTAPEPEHPTLAAMNRQCHEACSALTQDGPDHEPDPSR